MTRPTRPTRPTVAVRRLARALAAITPAIATIHAPASLAQAAAVRDYAIPAGTLSSTLTRFAAEAGVALSVDATLLEGRQSAGLQGRYGLADGFARLLHGSGLGFRIQDGLVLIVRADEAARQGRPAALLPEVQVLDRPDSLGTSVIDRRRLDALTAGNGDITSALRVLPNIQYDINQYEAGRQGEIAPAEVSIHGAKTYDNAFLFDGMSFSNNLDPIQTNPNNAAQPSSSSQGLAIDTSLLCRITVRDANVPAEFGHFSGGVISADTCEPTRSFGGSVSMEIARSDWMRYHLNEAQEQAYAESTSDTSAPEFDKRTYRVALQGRPTENLGLIASYVRKTSEIPLRGYAGGRISANDDSEKTEERLSENYFLRGFWTLTPTVKADLSVFHAPQRDRHFINNAKNSWFDIEQGGQGVNLGLSHRHDKVLVSHRLSWNEYESSRDAGQNWYGNWRYSAGDKNWGYRSSATAWNSGEGQYGDIEQTQRTASYQIKADWLPLQLANTTHSFQTGLEFTRQEKTFHRLEDAMMYLRTASTTTCATAGGGTDAEGCSLSPTWNGWPGQYFDRVTRYSAGEFELDNTMLSLFGQYELEWERLRLRLGARYQKDDLTPESTVSPRTALFWDVFGNDATRVELGANRYYSHNFMSHYTKQHVLALQSSGTRSLSGGVLSEWNYTPATSWRNYRENLNGLKTPYSDEQVVALSQRWLGARWGLKLVKREDHDQVIRRPHPDGGNVFANEGRSEARTAAFTIETERPLRLGPSWNTLSFGIDYTDVQTSHADYEELVTESEEQEPIRYDGSCMAWNERPADNYNRPVTARLNIITELPAQRLTIGNLFRYRDSYRKFVRQGTADCGGMVADNYELTTFRPAVTWDMRINYAIPVASGQEAFVALSIDNVLDRTNEIEDSSSGIVYEKGRQFWVEFGYRF